jgi:FkbM family methyltransferase
MIQRLKYYLSSLPTLLRHVQSWGAILKLFLSREPVIVRFRDGLIIKVRSLMDVWIVKETCLDRDYEVHGIEIEDGWQVIDIGAGLGDFVLSVAHSRPNCKIWAFEPFPESFQLLEENVMLNKVKNVVASQTAVSSQTGAMKMALTGAAVQHISFNAEAATAQYDAPVIEVQSQSLADLFTQDGLTHCDFLKIDCEGGEFDILLNASPDTLAKIHHICLEYHDNATQHGHQDLATFLKENGFEVRITSNPVHDYLGLLYARNLGQQ